MLDGTYSEADQNDVDQLHNYLVGKADLAMFNNVLEVQNGEIIDQPTILHARSVAEEIRVLLGNQPYSGQIKVTDGKIDRSPESPNPKDLALEGKSLMHSAPLTTIAFTKSWFGDYGKYIVSIGLLMFAFSTAISWSYYGGRAVTYLFGVKAEVWYRVVYVIGFFLASFTDTTIIWTLSGITIALMTIPNLIGILSLSKEMKSEVKLFWVEYGKRFPDEKVPKG